VPCIFVMRIRDGFIIESRDYIDPIAGARAWGRLDDLLTALRPQAL
jgi:ketosteroid isomerase-like protein